MLALLNYSHSTAAGKIQQANAEIPFAPVDVHPSMVNMDSKAGEELKTFIQHIFFQAHGAKIKYFMPQALSLRDNNQQLLAVAGLRSAQQSPFFLERYLSLSVEQEIAAKIGLAVDRSKIVEIGNLAVTRPAYTKLLMAALSAYLYSTDTEWIVFSALPVVKNAVAKMDHQMLVLADATINEIAEQDRADWGSYYEHHPQVIALRLKRNRNI